MNRLKLQIGTLLAEQIQVAEVVGGVEGDRHHA